MLRLDAFCPTINKKIATCSRILTLWDIFKPYDFSNMYNLKKNLNAYETIHKYEPHYPLLILASTYFQLMPMFNMVPPPYSSPCDTYHKCTQPLIACDSSEWDHLHHLMMMMPYLILHYWHLIQMFHLHLFLFTDNCLDATPCLNSDRL